MAAGGGEDDDADDVALDAMLTLAMMLLMTMTVTVHNVSQRLTRTPDIDKIVLKTNLLTYSFNIFYTKMTIKLFPFLE